MHTTPAGVFHVVCRTCTFESLTENRSEARTVVADHESEAPDHTVDYERVD